jgi:hypothetical protein
MMAGNSSRYRRAIPNGTIAVTQANGKTYLLRLDLRRHGASVHAVKSLAIKQEPPAAGVSILSWLYRGDSLEALLGDLEEEYQKRAMEHGVSAAQRWYYWQVARSVLVSLASALELVVRIYDALKKLGF